MIYDHLLLRYIIKRCRAVVVSDLCSIPFSLKLYHYNTVTRGQYYIFPLYESLLLFPFFLFSFFTKFDFRESAETQQQPVVHNNRFGHRFSGLKDALPSNSISRTDALAKGLNGFEIIVGRGKKSIEVEEDGLSLGRGRVA